MRSNRAGTGRAVCVPIAPDTPEEAAKRELRSRLDSARKAAGRAAARLALLCRLPDADPGALREAARTTASSAGLVQSLAALLTR